MIIHLYWIIQCIRNIFLQVNNQLVIYWSPFFKRRACMFHRVPSPYLPYRHKAAGRRSHRSTEAHNSEAYSLDTTAKTYPNTRELYGKLTCKISLSPHEFICPSNAKHWTFVRVWQNRQKFRFLVEITHVLVWPWWWRDTPWRRRL